MTNDDLTPRDVVKLAFQYQETEHVPYSFGVGREHANALNQYYGDASWQDDVVDYMGSLSGVDNFLAKAALAEQPDGSHRDCLGCVWQMGSTHPLVDWPLHEPVLGDYRLPALGPCFERHLFPEWPAQMAATAGQLRVIYHSFGLFERAWSLRGFEDFLVDLVENEAFAEKLLDHITEWLLQSDVLKAAPDARRSTRMWQEAH